MTSKDYQVGRNVRLLRGDLSQAKLAKAMHEAGFKWSQATVWSVESGERPVRLVEAIALASILHAPLEELAAVERDDLERRQAWRDYREATAAAAAAEQSLISAKARFDSLVSLVVA